MENSDNTRKKRKKGRKRALFILVFVIVGAIFSFFFGIIAGQFSYEIQDFFKEVQPEEMALDNSEVNRKLKNNEPFSVLLLGVDDREENARGRADTIIVATINPKKEDIYLLSIPRDTLITLPGTEEEIPDKINATYAYGYVPYMQETVEDFLNIPIDFFAVINFEGLKDLVDVIGGITVDSDLEFSISDTESGTEQHIEEGVQRLDGAEALGYARMRKEDPEGDFGRQERQREIIEALINKLKTFSSFSSYVDILNVLENNVVTDVSLEQAYAVFNNYRHTADNIKSLELEGTESTMYFPHYGLEVYVFDCNYFDKKEIQDFLARHLNAENFTNEPDENFDDYVTGFPFHSEDAVEELELEQYGETGEVEPPAETDEENYSEEAPLGEEYYEDPYPAEDPYQAEEPYQSYPPDTTVPDTSQNYYYEDSSSSQNDPVVPGSMYP